MKSTSASKSENPIEHPVSIVMNKVQYFYFNVKYCRKKDTNFEVIYINIYLAKIEFFCHTLLYIKSQSTQNHQNEHVFIYLFIYLFLAINFKLITIKKKNGHLSKGKTMAFSIV